MPVASDDGITPPSGMTIQGVPKLIDAHPKPPEKKVLPNGMLIVPPSASALNRLLGIGGSSTCSETENLAADANCRGVGRHDHFAIDRYLGNA